MTGPFVPYSPVTAPEPRNLRYGLFAAANGPLTLETHSRASGVTYLPVGCGVAHRYPAVCHTSRGEVSKTFDSEADIAQVPPFIVYSSLVCGSAGTSPQAVEQRAARRLADGEQSIVEAELETILDAGATPITAGDPTQFVDVIGELEQWLYGTQGYGYIGYLHAPFRFQGWATNANLVLKDGPLLRTPTGTIWVFGNYPDDGNIYISGQVTVWRSADVMVTSAVAGLNRENNQYQVLAEREYAVGYDCDAASAFFDWLPTS